MTVPTRSLPFTMAEYERRWAAVLAALDAYEIDALCVTARLHVLYLTASHGYGTFISTLILAPGRPPTFVVREYDEARVRLDTAVPEVRAFAGEDDVIEVWADTLRSMGLERARIGLELSCWDLAPADVSGLQALLPDVRVSDASRLVADLMDVKSAEELAAMRRAMELTEIGVRTFYDRLAEGVLEEEVAAACEQAMIAAGSEPLHPFELLFGGRTAVPHGSHGAYPLRRGDVAFVEFSGTAKGYSAGLCRTAILGRNPAAEDLHRVSVEALEAAIATIRPGVTSGEVDRACRSIVEAAGIRKTSRTGYSIGLGWLDRDSLSLKPGGTAVLKPDMTFHMPGNLFVPGRFGVGASETVLVTETGVEVLSRTPHELLLIG